MKIFDDQLRKDEEEFEKEFHSSRSTLMTFLDRSIDDLRRLKEEYQREFAYLHEENRRTCEDNRLQLQRLEQRNESIEEFRTNFPLRPRMLTNLPRFDLQSIPLDSFIKREEKPIGPSVCLSSRSPTESPRSVSSSVHRSRVDMAFRIAYKHPQHACLMSFNPDEKTLLIYCPSTKIFESVSLGQRRIHRVNSPWNESILTLGYSSSLHRFYVLTKETCRLTYFRVRDEHIDLADQHDLVDDERFSNLIIGHLFETEFYFISKEFDRFHLVKPRSQPIRFSPNILPGDDKDEEFDLIDFLLCRSSNIVLLVRLKKSPRSVIVVCDEELNPIHSFDLIEAKQPLTLISIFE